MSPPGIGYADRMLRSTVVTIASAINYGVAMAVAAFVIHVATGGILPVPATMGLVIAAGGIYALCTAALVQRADEAQLAAVPVPARAERLPRPAPAMAGTAAPRAQHRNGRRPSPQPAMALRTRPSSISV